MKYLFVLLAFLGLSLTLAQTELGFAEALNRAASNDADVATARINLESSSRDLSRLKQDPLALRIPILQAEHALEQARQSLELAILSAEHRVASAYASAKEAEFSLALSQAQLAINQIQLEATQIRFEAGAATQLDLERAQNTFASAQRELRDSEQARNLAFDQLASLVALDQQILLTEALPLTEVVSLESILARLESHSSVTRARQNLELAHAQLAAIDNAFSSRSSIEAARDTVSNAQTRLADIQRSLDIRLRQSYNAVLAAQSRLATARANLKASEDDLAAQELRFRAGSISILEFEQSKLSLMSAQAQTQTAMHGLAETMRQLEMAVKGGN